MRLFELFNDFRGDNGPPGDPMNKVLARHLQRAAYNLQHRAESDAEDAAGDDDYEDQDEELRERADAMLSLAVIFANKGMKAGLHALYNEYLYVADYAEEVARYQMNIDLHDMYKESGLSESKPAKKIVAKAPPPRNFVAKAVTRKSGSGSHSDNKFTRKEKHKNKEKDVE